MTSLDRPAILIVDDNPDKLVALESVLLELNVAIVKASSGEEALRRLLTEDFAVILLDVRMPGMDGFETAALIRQRPRTARTPIIFITAFGDETHVARGYSLRAVDYLLAPIVPDVLRTKVSVLVDLYVTTAEVRRQVEQQRRRALQLRSLSTASLQINSAASVDAILRIATEHARDIFTAAHAVACADAERHPGLRTVATAAGAPEPTDTDAALLADARATNRPQCAAGHDGTASHRLAVPFCGRDGAAFGAVIVCRATERFTQEDDDVLVQLAHMTAVAIENMAYREAREADRMKDEFLATVSHELRTPLSAMLSWAWMLRSGTLDADGTLRAVKAIERNAQAQARLVDDLLDVSRIMTGKLKLTRKVVDVATVVASATDAVTAEAQAKGVTLARLIDPQGAPVLGDADRLQQVIWNLLSNAIKFTPRGGRVDVQLERLGREMRVSITDTGVGIAPEFLPHVFERFRQADSSSTRAAGGLGLGLAIVRHLVEMHGGRAEAHSGGPERGSTFAITLPLVDGHAAVRPRSGAATRDDAGDATLGGLRILLVEDEPDAREALVLILSGAGAQVIAVGTAREALDEFARQRFALLVCDIGLPGEDGYALIGAVRARRTEDGGGVPAVALTAYAQASDRTRALAAGFQAHLAKPFEPRRLLEVLARITTQQPAVALETCAEQSA